MSEQDMFERDTERDTEQDTEPDMSDQEISEQVRLARSGMRLVERLGLR